MIVSPFDVARAIPSADIARREGLSLRRKGHREWTCCPFHGEKTPSLCFDDAGRWYCFGCHRHGDSVDLYAALRNVSLLEAARVLAGEDELPRRNPPPRQPKRQPSLSEPDEDGLTWDRLCSIRNAAVEVITQTENDPDNPRLWAAIAAKSAAEERMDNMQAAEDLHCLKGVLWGALNS